MFLLIQNHQLLKFCTDDLEYMAIFHYVFHCYDPLVELPFYEQLSVMKTDQAFKGYAMSYKVEIIEKKIQFYN